MARSHRWTLLGALAALVVAGVVVLVATGGGATRIGSASPLAEAARATEKLPGETVRADVQVDTPGALPLLIHLDGIAEGRHKSVGLTGSYVGYPKHVTGQSSDGSIPLSMVLLSRDMYVKSPLFTLPRGKVWLHIHLISTAGQTATTEELGQASPTQIVATLRASDRVERVGSEDVGGVLTTRYRATVELGRLPALAPPSARAEARTQAAALTRLLGSPSYPVDVSIDRNHILRRIRSTMTVTVKGNPVTVKMTTDLYGFGPKSRTLAPTAGDTYELP